MRADDNHKANVRAGIRTALWAGIFVLAIGIHISMTAKAADGPPSYKVDASWPKELPNNWVMGMIRGLAVDHENHIWVMHGRNSANADELGASKTPPTSECCFVAPPVLEFDAQGNLLKSWGGPGQGYDWPTSEHSIFVDQAGNVWISGNGSDKNGNIDRMVLKFTGDGKFLLQIGRPSPLKPEHSADTTLLGRVAGFDLDEKAHEIYMADGYLNRRVIVFNSDTGAFKRMWGAYGHVPTDAGADPAAVAAETAGGGPPAVIPYDPGIPPVQQFRPPVHCVRISNDGMVYVCDRGNDRIQVFTKEGKFVKEFAIRPETLGAGSVCRTCSHPPSALTFSPDKDQTYLFVSDGQNDVIWTLRRSDGIVLGKTGHTGQNAGQFHRIHSLGSDANGNLYTGELAPANRVQKFVPVRNTRGE